MVYDHRSSWNLRNTFDCRYCYAGKANAQSGFSRKPYIGLQSWLVQNCEDYNAASLSGGVCTEYSICY